MTARSSAAIAMLIATLLGPCAGPACSQPGPYRPVNVKRILAQDLANRVAEIDRTCGLTAEQRAKLELMGRGDIKRFLDLTNLLASERSFAKLANRFDIKPGVTQMPESPDAFLSYGAFPDGALIYRSLRTVLTTEQHRLYSAAESERHRQRQEQAIKEFTGNYLIGFDWKPADRERVIEFLRKIPPCANDGSAGPAYLALQASAILTKHPERLPDLRCRSSLLKIGAQYRSVELVTRLAGYFPEDDDPTN